MVAPHRPPPRDRDRRRPVLRRPTERYGLGPTHVTLYLPNVTVWVERAAATVAGTRSTATSHSLGVVPVVMHLNRRMSGAWRGESQMTDVIPLVDSAARSLTNLQFAQEAHGIPRMCMTGVAKGDFVDAEGDPIPQFEAYFDAIHTITNAQGKVGQLDAADLKNFETSLNIYGTQASVATGFPLRNFGISSVEPADRGLDPRRGDRPGPVGGGAERRGRHHPRLGRRARLPVRHRRRGRGQPGPRRLVRPGHPDGLAARGRAGEAYARPASCPARATGTSSAGPRPARPRSGRTSTPRRWTR